MQYYDNKLIAHAVESYVSPVLHFKMDYTWYIRHDDVRCYVYYGSRSGC